MLLYMSTWQEIEAYLKTSRTVVIPIGSNEQHGPTGLLGTDFLCPEIIAHEVSKRSDLLIAPTFNVGMAQHHLGFPGSISLRPSTFIAALTDWTRSLVGHGFERLYFLNGHGGNVSTIEAAFSEIYSAASFDRRTAGFTQRRLRSPSPSGPIRTPSRRPTTRPASHPPAPSAKPRTFAPAIPTAAWALTPTRPARPRARSWWNRPCAS
jgi:hypothetical protein